MEGTHSLNRVVTQSPEKPTDARACGPPARLASAAALLLSLGAVAVLTLSPAGAGWAWGAPLQELQWYAALSEQARTQLVGNVLLLTPAAAAATLLWPQLAARPYLPGWAIAAGVTIEVLQWLLPIGRVVSPVDALLNAAGAAAAAYATAHLRDELPVRR